MTGFPRPIHLYALHLPISLIKRHQQHLPCCLYAPPLGSARTLRSGGREGEGTEVRIQPCAFWDIVFIKRWNHWLWQSPTWITGYCMSTQKDLGWQLHNPGKNESILQRDPWVLPLDIRPYQYNGPQGIGIPPEVSYWEKEKLKLDARQRGGLSPRRDFTWSPQLSGHFTEETGMETLMDQYGQDHTLTRIA